MTEPITASPDNSPDWDPEAPYGRTVDGRPKRKPGRRPGPSGSEPATPQSAGAPEGPPSLEELRAAASGAGPAEDQEPGTRRRRRRGRGAPSTGLRVEDTSPRPEVPAFRAGPIAKGVNNLYRRAGKIIREIDPMMGAAIISTTAKEAEDDVTVGEAWEEIARTNPRIRMFLLKLISGGAWGQLLMCHLPIVMALLMKDSIRRRIPFGRILFSALSEDASGEEMSQAGQWPGFTPGDMEQAMAMAGPMFAEMMSRNGGMPRQPGMTEEQWMSTQEYPE